MVDTVSKEPLSATKSGLIDIATGYSLIRGKQTNIDMRMTKYSNCSIFAKENEKRSLGYSIVIAYDLCQTKDLIQRHGKMQSIFT